MLSNRPKAILLHIQIKLKPRQGTISKKGHFKALRLNIGSRFTQNIILKILNLFNEQIDVTKAKKVKVLTTT